MTNATLATGTEQTLSSFEAWRNALAISLLGCLLLGLGNAVVLARYLKQEFQLFDAAVLLEIGLSVSFLIILLVIVGPQRAHGSSLAALGWGRPTTRSALICGALMGLGWLGMFYAGIQYAVKEGDFPADVDVTEFSWTRLALAPLGLFMVVAEEIMMRGFFMTQLQRARVATWLQILASGVCTGIFHALQNFTLEGLIPGIVIFSLLAGIYVLGKRSLWPTILGHGLVEVLGEPYLLMMLLASM